MTTGKKKINSKAKGSSYELKIAKALGAWYGEDFNRVPASGGLRWGDDNRVAGDIATPVDSNFPFTVECKKREKWDLEQVLKGTGDVESWWLQSTSDSIRVNTRPLLIFSKNFAPDFLMITLEDFDEILHKKAEKQIPFHYFHVYSPEKPRRIICLLSDFTSFISKEDIELALPLKK